MKLQSITCPICNRKIRTYNPDLLEPGLASHMKRCHPGSTHTNIQIPEEHPYDFSYSGLGIGGLGTYQEERPIPTVAQMERLERMEQQATRCRRCGQTDVFDGAMFTTSGTDICDDCF